MNTIAWLRRQLDKMNTPNQLAQWGGGRWFVTYRDGRNTTTMSYGAARNYAGAFGGRVRHVSELHTVKGEPIA